MNEEHDYEYTMHMTIENVRLMSYCVEQRLSFGQEIKLDHTKSRNT